MSTTKWTPFSFANGYPDPLTEPPPKPKRDLIEEFVRYTTPFKMPCTFYGQVIYGQGIGARLLDCPTGCI